MQTYKAINANQSSVKFDAANDKDALKKAIELFDHGSDYHLPINLYDDETAMLVATYQKNQDTFY